MYIILEIQTYADGSAGTIVTKKDDRLEAESHYHLTLSAAAVSSVPMHSAVLMEGTGMEIEHKCYTHTPAELPGE